MKTCPHCISGYPDTLATCPAHGVLLNEIRDLKPGLVIRSTYQIVRKLGQGGMGSVYLAQQLLMGELRALKFIAPEMAADEGFVSRFLREVKSLHRLRHPNVIDCGDLERAEDNSLFFSMEYVEGPALREFLHQAGGRLPVELALEITRGIADGLGAAHRLGMVHRDIKPENILMAHADGRWLPKIADFGLVASEEYAVQRTHTGAPALTMPYAAPEQWLGARAGELDGRADLYALGGVLYEMLTGQTAFVAENYQGWFTQHVAVTPQPPSRLRPELAQWRGLDALVMQLLEKVRDQRPRDVAEVLARLDSVDQAAAAPKLTQPAKPTPPPPVTQATSQATANRLPSGAIPTPAPATAPRVASTPVAAKPTAARIKQKNTVPLEEADGRPKKKTSAARRLLELLVLALLLAVGFFSWKQTRPQARAITGHGGPVAALAYSPDGLTLASGSWDKSVRLWDAASGQPLRTLTGQDKSVLAVAYSLDGHTLASAGEDGAIRLWDAATGQPLRLLSGQDGPVTALAFSPDGQTLAAAGRNVRLWAVATGEPLRLLSGHSAAVHAVIYSPDGQMLATGGGDGITILWDTATGDRLRTLSGHQGPVAAVVFSPDGRTLATGSWDKTIRIWEAASGEPLRTLAGSTAPVLSLSFCPDGRTLASGHEDGSIRLWNPMSGERLRTLTGHSDHVEAVAFSPDGRTLASGSWDKTIRLWETARLR